MNQQTPCKWQEVTQNNDKYTVDWDYFQLFMNKLYFNNTVIIYDTTKDIYTYICVYIYIYVCVCVCVCMCMCVCVCVCMCVCLYR